MEHPYYLNQARPNDAVKQNVHWLSHACLIAAGTCMSEMKAPNSTRQLGAVTRRSAVRLSCDFAHRGREERRIAAPAFNAPSFGADGEYLREISSRQR